MHNEGSPTVILAKTIKGYGLGEGGEGKNITHQQKKLNEDELREFRGRFGIPVSDEELIYAPFYKPQEDHAGIRYMKERREALGGFMPHREVKVEKLEPPEDALFKDFFEGTDRPVSTTMAFVTMLRSLLNHEKLGKLIVPIVPDEARTFGMDGLFRQVGIYSSMAQLYEPVDVEALLYYREEKDGQILEEGITEAGSMSSFIAAGTAYATHGINTIPFFVYYSMFGYQRIGDLFWAAGDIRAKGFLVGGTAGRTTLNGEGLQHQDGHSQLFALAHHRLKAYDPAFAFEIAVIIQEGVRRMYREQEDLLYYMTVENENYAQPPMPRDKLLRENILKGLYKFRESERKDLKLRANLLGSGAIMNEVLKAQKMLEEYGVAADAWSATSYKELREDAVAAERWNMLHPGSKPRSPYVTRCFQENPGVVVASSDYVKALPDGIAKWVPARMVTLGTDGFGRSDSREALRDFFEVDARFITLATLFALADEGAVEEDAVAKAVKKLKINPRKPDPMHS